MKHKYAFVVLSAFAFMFASSAWALPGPTSAIFAKGAKFTVEGYAAGKPALTDFPVLVRIAENSPLGFSYKDIVSKTTGADIAFVDMIGNGLPFEIDTWNPDGTSLIWVRLPSMQNGTEFVMCWGGATSGKTVCGDNPFAGYKGVWHMNAISPSDASGSGNDGTGAGSVATTNGVVGSGLSYPDKTSYVSCGSSQAESELTANGYTVEGWVYLDNTSGNKALFGKSGFISYRMEGTSVKITTPAVADYGAVGNFITAAKEWHHFALSFKPNTTGGAKHYLDGVLKSTQDTGVINNKTGSIEMWLGRNQWGDDQNFVGFLDEYRLAPTIESGDWIAATYATQSDAEFLSAGEAIPYEETAEPQVGVVASDVQYTNATLSVSIGSLGKNDRMTADASWLDAVLLVATEDTFASPVISIPFARFTSAPTVVTETVVPLATNTTYYAKVLATNEFDVVGESSIAHFTMLAPGVPTGTAAFMERGFSTLSARATASNLGIGAESATMRLEASTDGFATISASSESPATLGEQASFIVNGLTPGTEYALRVRIRNDWGIDTYIPLPDTSTRSVPFATTGIGWTFSPDGSTIDISMGISGIYDGADGFAMLTYNGVAQTMKAVSGIGTLTWPAIPAANGTAAVTVVLSATLDNQTYSQTFSATIALGSMAVAVSDFTEHQSAETFVRVNIGDVITLPELAGTDFYYLGNNRFASLDGNVLTAIEGGILGVFCVTDDGATTNTLPVIVLPKAVGNGSVYVYKETVSAGDRIWTSAAAWEKIGAETNDSWPKNADDIAVLPFYQYSNNDKYLRLKEDVTIGGLYYGSFLDKGNDKLVIERHKDSTTRTMSFERTDGEPAIVKICANTTGTRQNQLTFGGFEHSTAYLSDTILDAGWDGSDNANCRGRFSSAENNTNTIPAGVTVSVVNFDRTGNSMGATMWPGHMKGAGIFWNRSSGTMRWDGGLANFTGTIRDSGGYRNDSSDRSGPVYFRTPLCTNVAVEVIGQVPRNGGSPRTDWGWEGVGALKVGWNHGYGSEPQHPGTNWFPRAVLLHGGTLVRHPNQQGAWSGGGSAGGVKDLRHTERLTVEGGLNNIVGLGSDNAINWLEADEFVQSDKATVRVVDESRWSLASTATKIKEVTILHGVSAYLVGAAGNPEASDVYPIVPWMVSPITSEDDCNRYPLFACFDENDRLIRPYYNNTALDGAASDKSNAYVWDKTIQIADDVTLNSLYLNNGNKNKYLGEGRKLTLTSGGLVLHNDNSAIGLPGRPDNGSLVLGDASHPGYVFAKSGSASSPNQIWADVTAPGGFVAAYTGNLILGGEQTGIGDEIAVNAGSLQLGTADNSCQLAKDLPIRIYANATLKLPNASSTAGNVVKFDGAAGWFGKVEIPAGVAAKCRKAYWRDYPEVQEWQSLPSGIYGSSESGAPNVRDDLFAGAGTLQVLRDDSTMPFIIIVR